MLAVQHIIMFCGVVPLFVEGALLAHSMKGVAFVRRVLNFLFPLSQALILLSVFSYMLHFGLPIWLFVVAFLVSVLCVAGDPMLFKALKAAEDRDVARERVRILEEQNAIQQSYFTHLEGDLAEARKVRERILGELRSTEGLLEQGQGGGVDAHLRQIADLAYPIEARFCENQVVDALLAVKSSACKRLGITLETKLLVPAGMAFPNVDLCAIFSNVIDNALHGCEEAARPGRFIAMRSKVAGGYFILEVENSCSEAGEGRSGGEAPRQRGQRLSEHGWGLAILEVIAEQHDGSVETERSAGVYRTSVVVRLQQD